MKVFTIVGYVTHLYVLASSGSDKGNCHRISVVLLNDVLRQRSRQIE